MNIILFQTDSTWPIYKNRLGEKKNPGGGVWKCAVWLHVLFDFFMLIFAQTHFRRRHHQLVRSNAVSSLHLINDFPPFTCDSCEYAKATCKIIRKEQEASQAGSFGVKVHTNVWGPRPTKSLGGCKYYITFTDGYSPFTQIEALWTKDKAFGAYKVFAA